MKLDKLVGERFKERPADCAIDSHALMTRGGYMKYVGNGIYSSYNILRRITKKIERIIREEMDAIDGQEVLFPVAMPASLLEESGRFHSIGGELLRFADRNGAPMVLGMTHEEAAVQLTREYGQSYVKYPFMVYQIQTKFRDEQRPRGGLIRVREFTMKDAYSFHVSQDDLEIYYRRCFHAYEQIFARVGIPEVISVAADSGMMGGSVSHEFMLLTPVGEDSIVICGSCDYRANLEAAECVAINKSDDIAAPLAKVHTPDMKTIADVCAYLDVDVSKSCKAVAYQKLRANVDGGNANSGGGSSGVECSNVRDGEYIGEYIIVFLRGDLDINETKLRNYLGCDIQPAVIADGGALQGGFIGPYRLPSPHARDAAKDAAVVAAGGAGRLTSQHEKDVCPTAPSAPAIPGASIIMLFDNSLKDTQNLCCGANELDYHYTGLCISRDIGDVEYHDFAKATGSGACACPSCGNQSLTVSRGIEVGNIFQLGSKYTVSMNMRFMDERGESQYPIMGCYGIGIERLAASVCEARHDDYGPIWPMAIAPWQVHLCCLRADDQKVKSASDGIYESLLRDNIEVIYDDRVVSAGVMFSDADLIGAPLRVIVSPRGIKDGCCEIAARDKSMTQKIAVGEAPDALRTLIYEMTQQKSKI